MRQQALFDVSRQKKPRKAPCKRGTLMYVCDAGSGDSMSVRFECGKCGHVTDWTEVRTVTEAKKGKPCPICNTDEITHVE